MTIEERTKIAHKLFEEAMKIMVDKSKSYSGVGTDSLANFKRGTQTMDLSKYQVWQVYFNKHIDSINSAITGNPEHPVDFSESLKGRVIDVINYATILICLLEEDEIC